MKQPLIQMRNIEKKFPGVVANDHVNIELFAGEIHAFWAKMGRARVRSCLSLPDYTTDAGEILIDGVPVVFASPRAAIEVGIGMVISILSWLSRLQLLKTFSW